MTSAEFVATDVECVSMTDQFKPYTTSSSDQSIDDENDEREDNKVKRLQKRGSPPAALRGMSQRRRRAFCSCLNLKPGTSTKTHTTYLLKDQFYHSQDCHVRFDTLRKSLAQLTHVQQIGRYYDRNENRSQHLHVRPDYY